MGDGVHLLQVEHQPLQHGVEGLPAPPPSRRCKRSKASGAVIATEHQLVGSRDAKRATPTSLSIGVGVDLSHQEATLVQLAVGLQGGAHQRVSCVANALHGVRGGVCAGVGQLGHGLPQLLLVTSTHKEQ